jgi:cyclopropane-fatty-acyl-phospholipid synthase
LTVVDGGERRTFGKPTPEFPVRATVHVHDPSFYSFVALSGSNGAGEAFIRGFWSADDLTEVIRIFVRNRDALDAMEAGWSRLVRPAFRFAHWLNRNTVDGSRRNIAAHYDLGNDFFRRVLDPTMTYSCGWFEHPGQSLEAASVAKLDRICRKLRLGPDDHVLEIGTGWGSFALHAAQNFGCRVTTTTISREQHAVAAERIRAAGLEDRITLLLEDYRQLEGRYDKVVSIEMIEAVGHHYYDTFFRVLNERLKPDGTALIQAIVIADQHYDRARREVDFIKKYVFPGSCIPSVSALLESTRRASSLRLHDLEDLTPHYVQTLRGWRENFSRNLAEIRQLGYSEDFLRLWEFYLAYCEGGFAERFIGDVHLVLAKPGARPAPVGRRLPGEIGGGA